MNDENILLSICIPTYERARYLDCVLTHLAEVLGEFPYSYEIVISDNASTDNTSEIVQKWQDKLPIRAFRQDTNIGMFRNPRFVLENARGIFSVYLADDDLLDMHGLKLAIEKLRSEPEAVVLYAPWTLVDLVNDKVLNNFYELPTDVTINKGNFIHLLSLILQHHIFAEIAIFRTESFRTLMPRENDLAYWSFTIPAEFLTIGKVIFLKTPFYKSVTNYFPGERRSQSGHEQAESSWDRYTGGLLHLLGLSRPGLTEANIAMLRDEIDKFVISRMLVALKLRLFEARDPLESYYLASRLRGLGADSRLPRPFEIIRAQAALWFVTHDESLLEGARQIVLVGGFEQSVADYLGTIAQLPIVLSDGFPDDVRDSIVIVRGAEDAFSFDRNAERARNNKVVLESGLMNKFL